MGENCIFTKFCFHLLFNWSKTGFFVKSGLIGQFLQNEVLKIINENFFGHKIKNAGSIGFPHRFSISEPKVTPKGLEDAPDPQEAVRGRDCHRMVRFLISLS